MWSDVLPRLIGFDPQVVRRLAAPLRVRLAWLALAWLASLALLASTLGITTFLAEHSFAAAACVTLCAGLILLNLLRLANASAASARLTPTVVFGLMAAVLAQPAHLATRWLEFEPAVEAHRKRLLDAQQVAATIAHASMAGAPREDEQELLKKIDSYVTRLQTCPFLVLRLGFLWRRPQGIVRFTVAFVLLALLPAALAQSYGASALRAYEDLHHARQERLLGQITAEGARAVALALLPHKAAVQSGAAGGGG